MNKDFYKVLGLRSGATYSKIRRAYCKLALRYHPERNHHPHAAKRFAEVAEALVNLSSKRRRDLFDAPGEEGVQQRRWFFSRYKFRDDPFATFAMVFGENSDNDELQVALGSGSGPPPKGPPIEHVLLVTLEEIARGCTKRLKISQRRILSSGQAIQRYKMLDVEIRPGWKAGTRITFLGEGDEMPNRRPGDLIFVLREKSHPLFRREGCDLYYTAQITLKEALNGVHLKVPTIWGGTLHICTTGKVINAESERRFSKQGLPHQDEASTLGGQVVNFNIVFPKSTVPSCCTSSCPVRLVSQAARN